MNTILIRRSVLAGLALATLASAQQIPFQLVAVQGNSAVTIQNGGGVTMTAPVGQAQQAQIKLTYSGTGKATITQQPFVIGSMAFTASFDTNTMLPITLNPGGTVLYNVLFRPTAGGLSAAQINLPYSETLIVPPAVPGFPSTTTTNVGAINVSVQGTAPSFVFSYSLQSDPNVVPLQTGDSLVFPPTLVNSTAQAALNLTNSGSGPGIITGISITGDAFRLTGKPLLPVTIPATQNLQLVIRYTPTGVKSDTGEVQITFDGGSVTIGLQGSGSAAVLTYQVLQTDQVTTVPAGGTVPLPDTTVGQTSSVVIRILNAGNASGTVSSISLAGQGYQLGPLGVLPQTLAPNGSLTFTLNFTPTAPGTVKGSLFINSDALALAGVGLGPQLGFSYVAGGTTVVLTPPNSSVVFSPVTISQGTQVTFIVKNTGTQPATISSIGIGQASSPFSITGLPALPVSLPPNADLRFQIAFAPTTLGFSNGTVLIDTTSVALTGSGTQPPPLPAYTITGVSGTVASGTQPNISLTLASPYGVGVSGVLTLSVSGSLPADPGVQFSSGGVTVPFTIPANTTTAQFGNQPQIGLQTGTVASTITVIPTFATKIGGVDLTPNSPTTLQFSVASAAPTLSAIQISNVTATGFVISVTGFTTTRALTAWTVQFTTAPGFTMPVTKFTIDVSAVSNFWFQSTASRAFGSQFTLSIPFTLQGTVATGTSLLNSISSVSVTLSNAVGTSNSIQASVP